MKASDLEDDREVYVVNDKRERFHVSRSCATRVSDGNVGAKTASEVPGYSRACKNCTQGTPDLPMVPASDVDISEDAETADDLPRDTRVIISGGSRSTSSAHLYTDCPNVTREAPFEKRAGSIRTREVCSPCLHMHRTGRWHPRRQYAENEQNELKHKLLAMDPDEVPP